ncbi:hypothetical protein C8R47DRAFT_538169 [Mycena vitilis]|nr:hypothetical protein C8R47DRAFT_538169 [Mycena vitilis]
MPQTPCRSPSANFSSTLLCRPALTTMFCKIWQLQIPHPPRTYLGRNSIARTSSTWLKFRELVDVRLKLLPDFESEGYVSRRACDNMECGIIQDKSSLRYCSGCRELSYCSRYCQRMDWHSGHRESCVWLLFRHTTHARPRSRACSSIMIICSSEPRSTRPSSLILLSSSRSTVALAARRSRWQAQRSGFGRQRISQRGTHVTSHHPPGRRWWAARFGYSSPQRDIRH